MPRQQPKPGDFGVVTGSLADAWHTRNLGAALIELGTRGRGYHALIATSATQAIEARPHGAGYVTIGNYGDHITWSQLPLSTHQRAQLVTNAESYIGTPYGWDDDACIGLSVLGLRNRWVLERLNDPDTVMCSQLVSMCYARAGIPLGDKDPALTTPNDLLHILQHTSEPRWW